MLAYAWDALALASCSCLSCQALPRNRGRTVTDFSVEAKSTALRIVSSDSRVVAEGLRRATACVVLCGDGRATERKSKFKRYCLRIGTKVSAYLSFMYHVWRRFRAWQDSKQAQFPHGLPQFNIAYHINLGGRSLHRQVIRTFSTHVGSIVYARMQFEERV